jgi:hypothetical protein
MHGSGLWPQSCRTWTGELDAPFGDPKDAESMQRAVARWHAWMEQRRRTVEEMRMASFTTM